MVRIIPNAAASIPERARMPPEAPPHSPIPTPKAKEHSGHRDVDGHALA
jgi:hypothetical protein